MAFPLIPFFAVLALHQQTPPVGSKPAEQALPFPDLPFDLPGFETVTEGDSRYWVFPNGDIGPRLPAANWKGLPATDPPKGTPALKIRIISASEASLVGNDAHGRPVVRRTSLVKDDLAQVRLAGNLVHAAMANLGIGPKDVQITYQDDSELYLFDSVPFDGRLDVVQGLDSAAKVNDWMFQNLVVPHDNVQKFDTEDPTDYGPYDWTVVVHAGLVDHPTVYIENGRKALVYPYYSSTHNAAADLASSILALLLESDPNYRLIMSRIIDQTNVWMGVRDQAMPLVKQSATWSARPSTSGGPGNLNQYSGPGDPDGNPMVWLGLKPDPEPFLPSNTLKAFGGFSAKPVDDGFEVMQSRNTSVGYATIPFTRQAPQNAAVAVDLNLKSDSLDAYALQLVSPDGRVINTVQLSLPAAPEDGRPLTKAMVPFDGAWQPVHAVVPALNAPVAEVRLVPYPAPGELARGTVGDDTLSIKGLTLSAAKDGDKSVVTALPNAVDKFLAQTSDVPVDLPGNIWSIVKDAITAPDVRLQTAAAALLTHTKHGESVPLLATVAASANDIAAPLAAKALAFQDTPESWAALKQVLEKGPFVANQKAAWVALAGHPKDASYTRTATILSTAPSWVLRKDAVELQGEIGGEMSGVTILTAFQDIDPGVRLAVPSRLNADQDFFARRLLYVGVNDPSESVRVACLVRLLDSKIDDLRSQAQRGVRDESIGVRLGLLHEIQKRANESDRPALQLAMTDKDNRVLVAALNAYAVQPGAVDIRELQSVLATTNPQVAAALLNVAIAKKLTLPESTVSNFQKLGDKEVARLLNKLGGKQ